MQYRKLGRIKEPVSAIGLGMMRVPLLDGSEGFNGAKAGQIDRPAALRILREAVDLGINYIDTAYNYLSGESEVITGEALKEGYRDKVILVSKAPTWLFKSSDDFDKYLHEQLRRLGTNHIDLYLLHSMTKVTWPKTVLRYDIPKKLEEAKAAGKIRYIGFSFHDTLDQFRSIIDYYDNWDTCQIQLNYMDTNYQAGIAGLEYAASKGLGVSIMEPLRGGYLARLPQDANQIFCNANPNRPPAEWAFDFLWDRPEVGVVLSGMTSIQQVKENVSFAERSRTGMLSEQEKTVYRDVLDCLKQYDLIPCTGCNYCMNCPKRVAIPVNFALYNQYKTTGDLKAAKRLYNVHVPMFGAKAEACVGCKQCEEICPQHIEISRYMPAVAKLFAD